jgi:hypothetical protein
MLLSQREASKLYVIEYIIEQVLEELTSSTSPSSREQGANVTMSFSRMARGSLTVFLIASCSANQGDKA